MFNTVPGVQARPHFERTRHQKTSSFLPGTLNTVNEGTQRLRTPPRREYRMLFAELRSRDGRSTPNSLQPTHLCRQHATFLVLRLSMTHKNSAVHTEYTKIDLTHTVSSFSEAPLHLDDGMCLPNPHVTSAHGRTLTQYRCHGGSSCHRTDHERGRSTNDSLVLVPHSIHQQSKPSVCLHHSPVPGLQRSQLSRWLQERLPACSCTLSSPPSPRPLYPSHSDSFSCHSDTRRNVDSRTACRCQRYRVCKCLTRPRPTL